MDAMISGSETLSQSLRPLGDRYDFILIDCPPTGGQLTASAIQAADETIITVDTGFFALYGVSQLLEFIEGVSSEAREEKMRIRALATMYDGRTTFSKEILKDLHGYFGSAMFQTVIRNNVRLKEASSYGVPIVEYDAKARGAADYMLLAQEVIAEC